MLYTSISHAQPMEKYILYVKRALDYNMVNNSKYITTPELRNLAA